MSAEKELLNNIRMGLQEKHGKGFNKLTEEQKNDLILLVIQEHIEEMRKEKRHR